MRIGASRRIPAVALAAYVEELCNGRASQGGATIGVLCSPAPAILVRNPCQVERAGVERAAERPVATVAEVVALADAIVPRFRGLLLLASWCGLRRGDLLALRRQDLDLLHPTVRVERAAHQLADGDRARAAQVRRRPAHSGHPTPM